MRKLLLVSVVISAILLTACTSHYQLMGVSRTRILIDHTYDAQLDAAANAFLAPYKHQVDSVMGPVVGEVAHDMAADRPESDLSNLTKDDVTSLLATKRKVRRSLRLRYFGFRVSNLVILTYRIYADILIISLISRWRGQKDSLFASFNYSVAPYHFLHRFFRGNPRTASQCETV